MCKLNEIDLLVVFLGVIILFSGCSANENSQAASAPSQYQQLEGKTMGTTYHITYADRKKRSLQSEIDQLLKEVNDDVNTYVDTSFISVFNQAPNRISLGTNYASSNSPHRHFLMNFYKAKEVFEKTNGYLDPTIMPLVAYWGFGKKKEKVTAIDKQKIASLMEFVGFDGISIDKDNKNLLKAKPGMQLDFSAIAKGYGVDAICELFDREGVANYLVEIGGEVRTKGKNPDGKIWRLGINTPKVEAGLTDYETIVQVPNRALASSGNYRNFYEIDGRKYAHCIDPKTGYPKNSDILSASIFADDCMTADGYATACIVMGLEKAYAMIQKIPEVEAYFIYGDENGAMAVKYTDGVKDLIVKE